MTKLLKLRSDLFQLVFSIPTARTPIIRFMHASTEINCDLSFMNGLSVENTKFVKFCYDLQPISRDAVLLLRCFSNIESLYGEYKICSYAFSMMLLFYMQTKGWLLSVQRLRSLTNTDVQVIDGWPIIDYNESVETLKQNVEEYTGGGVYQLVKGFFEFYNEFNFEKDVVCPFMGVIVKRKQFNGDGVNLPSEMSVYRKNLKEGESFRVDDCYMCVQDPFDLSHNLTKAVSSDAVASFKFKCRNVLQMFSH
ncbi:PREDICTED: speckle targeted PIP5K1A-regulated poly(A) polymerase [Nicrophorus vespilloides]|uniref:Speckle targeted PIP5K1A-regulated poly(A) polymerase n=1 Tax=Nicrophorus vespilloides TaxID=110193 RepID=A0ABM1M6T9_NICVS|nr:PREDICTED: speckle targeted PIP5K1A-regulated poly(A) polymerase [Nicrophorus vespilloides]